MLLKTELAIRLVRIHRLVLEIDLSNARRIRGNACPKTIFSRASESDFAPGHN